MTEEYRSLRIERSGPVAEVILVGPGKGNAMGPDLFNELPPAFGALDRDPEVRAVVLRGQGEQFCFGLDIYGMSAELTPLVTAQGGVRAREKLLDFITHLQTGVSAVALCRKPVIAAIHGWCVGGGLDLAAACDLRFCSAAAKFSLREVKLAIVADLGSLERLPRIIGEGHTRELAFTGRDFDAAEADRIGLVNRVYPDGPALLEGARAVAAEMAVNPPLAVQGLKQVLNRAVAGAVGDGLRDVAVWNAAFLQSQDLVEAFTAFLERRPPVFKGE